MPGEARQTEIGKGPVSRLGGAIRNSGLLEIAGLLGGITIVLSATMYVLGAEQRRQDSHFAAWGVINSAHGQRSSGGRVEALELLAKDQVPLLGVDLSNAWLYNLSLPGAELTSLNLDSVRAVGLNFQRAQLALSTARGAHFMRPNVVGADFYGAILNNSMLRAGQLCGTRFVAADMRGVNLGSSNVYAASFWGADLRSARLQDIRNWREIEFIRFANVWGIEDAPEGFIDWALEQGAVVAERDEDWDEAQRADTVPFAMSAEWLNWHDSVTYIGLGASIEIDMGRLVACDIAD